MTAVTTKHTDLELLRDLEEENQLNNNLKWLGIITNIPFGKHMDKNHIPTETVQITPVTNKELDYPIKSISNFSRAIIETLIKTKCMNPYITLTAHLDSIKKESQVLFEVANILSAQKITNPNIPEISIDLSKITFEITFPFFLKDNLKMISPLNQESQIKEALLTLTPLPEGIKHFFQLRISGDKSKVGLILPKESAREIIDILAQAFRAPKAELDSEKLLDLELTKALNKTKCLNPILVMEDGAPTKKLLESQEYFLYGKFPVNLKAVVWILLLDDQTEIDQSISHYFIKIAPQRINIASP